MDAETQRAEGAPTFNIDHLNDTLAACEDGLSFEVIVDAHPHSTVMEAYVSQSDFGLVIEYDNHLLPEHSWSSAYLVQAKRLFRSRATDTYDGTSRFESADRDQQARLEELATILGPGALLYGLYCPPTGSLVEVARKQVRALHTTNLNTQIFDYAIGQALKDWLKESQGLIEAGIWFTPIAKKPTSLMPLHRNAFCGALPLTWFFLDHFDRVWLDEWGSVGRLRQGWPCHAGEDDKVDNAWVREIVRGNRSAIDALLTRLEGAGGGDRTAPESLKVLPRHTVTIKVSVGRDLPPDLARIQAD